MAAEKTTRRKQKDARGEAGEGKSALRTRSDPRKERRYEPKASAVAVVSVVGMSIGAVLLGAGVYGQWLRGDELGPHKAAPWLLLGGALLLLAVGLFGPRAAKPVRVGDAGVGLENDAGEIQRIGWHDVTRIVLGSDLLTVQASGASISIPVKLHAQAAARLVAEARARVPSKVEDVEKGALAAVEDDAGEVLPLDPPQAAGSRCKATDKLIAFEKDARYCGRCGEIYHKESVPPKCLTCDAKLAT
jgi:hypothetical protein